MHGSVSSLKRDRRRGGRENVSRTAINLFVWSVELVKTKLEFLCSTNPQPRPYLTKRPRSMKHITLKEQPSFPDSLGGPPPILSINLPSLPKAATEVDLLL